MKLSPRTLGLLKNFSNINSNILIKSGNELRTVNGGHTIMAFAEITESFPREVPIYDLAQFLGAMSLLEEPELDFLEKFVQMTGKNGQKIRFFYSDPSLIIAPGEKKIAHLPSADISFKLKNNQLSEILRAASILQLPEIVVRSTGGAIEFAATDTKNKTSNYSSTTVDGAGINARFNMIFKVDNLKMIPANYDVEICAKGIAKFATSEGGNTTYFVAVEAHSDFNGATRG